MIQEYVDIFMAKKAEIREQFKEKHPGAYIDIVRSVVKFFQPLNSSEIHEIDDGDYQGTLLFLIPEDCYQPDNYWYVKISYGSCSGCDTLESISCYSDEPPTEEQVDEYMTLCLHVVQELKKMEEGSV